MSIDPAAMLSEGLEHLNKLKKAHLSAQRQVDAVKAEVESRVTESKERVRAVIDSEKNRHSGELDAAKGTAEAIVSEAKERAAAVIAEAKQRIDGELSGVRQQTSAEHAEVVSQGDKYVSEAVAQAETPRGAYADGIAELVKTGWATTASLAAYGHRTPKRPKGVHE